MEAGGEDSAVDPRCPACTSPGLELRTVRKDLPHFGETVETVALCSSCGFRHVDCLIVGESDPVRYTFPYAGGDDLHVRVVKSNTATVRVPELGLEAEPGAQADAFVSNVEGLLDRLREAFRWAAAVSDDPGDEAIAEERLAELDEAIDGEAELTVILEDPRGNSAILSDKAKREVLTDEEAAQLATGEIVLDAEDLGLEEE